MADEVRDPESEPRGWLGRGALRFGECGGWRIGVSNARHGDEVGSAFGEHAERAGVRVEHADLSIAEIKDDQVIRQDGDARDAPRGERRFVGDGP